MLYETTKNNEVGRVEIYFSVYFFTMKIWWVFLA